MAHILALELKQRVFSGGRVSSFPPAEEPEKVATVWVDWDRHKWEVRTRQDEFEAIFHQKSGTVTSNQGFLFGDSDQTLADSRGADVVLLQQYGLNPQAKLSGIAMFGTNPQAVHTSAGGVANAFLYYTFFWRKVSGQDMTKRERAEEMYYIATTKYGYLIGSDALSQIKGLATAESLFSMGAVLLLFATATALGIAGLVGAMRVICGTADVVTNWQIYKPYWDRFAQQINSGNDLDYGAQALATLLGGLLGYTGANVVGAKLSKLAAPHIQKSANKLANAVKGASPERWRQAAEQGKAELQKEAADKGRDTKMDPAKDITPEERRSIETHQTELLAEVRSKAAHFGFPKYIAEGYAMLAFRNKWTIIARTSKSASIPHHFMGEHAVTGKSLYVQYKIDAKYGVITEEWGRNIETDFYDTHSYAAKQIEAIYYAENPTAKKGSFQVNEEVMREFRQAHQFEFREVKIEGKSMKVLFHNGKMVIGDVDLMGIYVRRGNDLIPLPQWMIHNDAAFLQDFINRNIGGVKTSFHGQQDVGRSSKGKPFRAPDADENYAVFSPDMTLTEVKGTTALERMYRNAHIHWPYDTYVSMNEALTHFAVSLARKKSGPNR